LFLGKTKLISKLFCSLLQCSRNATLNLPFFWCATFVHKSQSHLHAQKIGNQSFNFS
jgi:hypothetical protein